MASNGQGRKSQSPAKWWEESINSWEMKRRMHTMQCMPLIFTAFQEQIDQETMLGALYSDAQCKLGLETGGIRTGERETRKHV